MNKALLVSVFCICIISISPAQEKIDTAIVSRIKKEGFDNSQVMNILGMLTDVNGPRLTNSPGYKKAAEYSRSTLASWV